MEETNVKRYVRLIAIFAVLSLVLAACGDDVADDTTTTEAPDVTTVPDETTTTAPDDRSTIGW